MQYNEDLVTLGLFCFAFIGFGCVWLYQHRKQDKLRKAKFEREEQERKARELQREELRKVRANLEALQPTVAAPRPNITSRVSTPIRSSSPSSTTPTSSRSSYYDSGSYSYGGGSDSGSCSGGDSGGSSGGCD